MSLDQSVIRVPRFEEARRGYVQAGKVRLSYLELGEGPPLILLHGFPQSPYCWRFVMPHLARTHRVLAFDLKGYGESDKPEGGYDLGTLTAEMREAVRKLGYDRAAWVGHDWGGALLWAIALRYPEVVERFAIINAPLHRISPVHSWYIVPFVIPGLMERLLSRFNNRFISATRGYAYDPKVFGGKDLREYARAFARPGVHSAALAWYRTLWKSAPQALYWRRRRVQRPCLIIWGIHDPALPVGLLKGIEKYIEAPLKIYPVPQCGHWVMEEQPEVTRELLAAFLMPAKSADAAG